MTVRAEYHFVVKAHADGTPWVMLEPMKVALGGEGLPRGFFGFDLPAGTSGAKAQEISDYLDQHLLSFTFTQSP
jgi:hypothetical protein